MTTNRIQIGGNGGGRIRLGADEELDNAVQQNTTSMIDVIFILLVFFVAVSRLKDSPVDVNLPGVDDPGKPKVEQKIEPIEISITAEGTVYVGSEKLAVGPDLKARIEQLVAENGTDVTVRLRSDSESKSGSMVQVISLLSAAGLQKVEFAVRTVGESG